MFPEFEPHPTLPDPHSMTVFGTLLPRRGTRALTLGFASEDRIVPVDEHSRVLVRCHWQPAPAGAPTLVLLHGMCGSADSPFLVGTGGKALRRGFNVVRMNMRNCGGTEHLSSTLFHSGLSDDIAAVLRSLRDALGLRRFCLAGFSMGGNMVLRLAGSLPDDLQGLVTRAVAISPALDLARAVASVDRGLRNVVYRWSFLWYLRALAKQKARRMPERFDRRRLRGVRTIEEFDQRFTAPNFGFCDAATYYREATALPFLPRIAVPTLIIQAQDDPLVPGSQIEHPAVVGNPLIRVLAPAHGGHCTFFGRRPAEHGDYLDLDRFWAENRALQFCAAAPLRA